MIRNIFLATVLFLSHATFTFADTNQPIHEYHGLKHVNHHQIDQLITLKSGELLTKDSVAEMIRKLYATGYFKTVSIDWEQGKLVIDVVENPRIASIEHNGIDLIPEEKFTDILNQLHLKKGAYFQESKLSELSGQIKQLYDSMGYFRANIDIDAEEKHDFVHVKVAVKEGKQPTIKKIMIQGNHNFAQALLLKQLSQKSSSLVSHFFKEDRYAKQKMDADIATLKSYYLDHGYMSMQVEDLVVSLTPDKRSIYIAIIVHEGEQTTLASQSIDWVDFDSTVLSKKETMDLNRRVKLKKSRAFSRKNVIETSQIIKEMLGGYGYAYAEVQPETKEITSGTISVNYKVRAGKPYTVRKINFTGNTITNTLVLRRYLNQMEYAPYSARDIKQSEKRLSQLKWIKNVTMTLEPVADSDDLVDIQYEIEEQSSAQIMLEASYSPNTGASLGFSFLNDNFIGSGRAFSASVNKSKSSLSFNVSYSNPFITESGISQSFNLYHTKTKPGRLELTDYVRNSSGIGMHFGHPITDFFRMGYGLSLEHTKLIIGHYSSDEVKSFESNYGDQHTLAEANLGFSYNTYNSGMWPSEGLNLSFSASAHRAINESKINYYKTSASISYYQPISAGFVANARASVGFTDPLSSNSVVPFFDHYYAGGIGTVAGYQSYSLGPKDSRGRSYGGQLQTLASLNLIVPTNLGDTVRTSLFLNAGNVFEKDFDRDELRYSMGASLTWLTILGPLEFVIAKPIHKKEGDQLSSFDFTISAGV